MKYDLRELFPFGIISDAPSVSYLAALLHRIAAETLDMNNPTAWRDILPRLRAAGVPHREALTVRRDVWDVRKATRAAKCVDQPNRCGGGRS